MARKTKLIIDRGLLNAMKEIRITLSGKDGLQELAKAWRDRIVNYTRAGKDLSGGQDEFRIAERIETQPPLQPSTIRSRRRLEERGGRVHPLFRPNFSNLTESGDLLDGLTPKANYSRQEISVEVGGKRHDGEDNKEIAEDLASRGRRFLGLDREGAKTLQVRAKANILRQLQAILRKKR